MSNNLETCKICGSNDLIQFCANCGTKCCKKCYEHHDANVCTYIKETKCHLCEIHGEIPNSVTGYCFQCQYLVCDVCRAIGDHDHHSIVGLTEALFIVQSEQYAESDEKRSMDTTSDIKKLLETLTNQIENQCEKIVDCISEQKCKLLSKLNEHSQYLKEYSTEREKDIQSVREDMSEFKLSRAVFPLLFLHKWQVFAKQMNKLEKPADRLIFLCGFINKSDLDEMVGKLENVNPQKDKKVEKLTSKFNESLMINDTYTVSRQEPDIRTQNDTVLKGTLGPHTELESLRDERNFMIQRTEETCRFVTDCNRKLAEFHIHVHETKRIKTLGNTRMDLFSIRMDYITQQFNMIVELGFQKEKELLKILRKIPELTNESNSDIDLKQTEIRNLKKQLDKLSNDLKSKDKRISELEVNESDARKAGQNQYDNIEKLQKQHNKEIESINIKLKNQSDQLKKVQNEKERIVKMNRQTQEETTKILKENDANILQLQDELKTQQARFSNNTINLQNKLSQGETERMNLRQILKEKKQNIKTLVKEKDELQTRLSSDRTPSL